MLSEACKGPQVVREHALGLSCLWDARGEAQAGTSGNGALPADPEEEQQRLPFTTWKFRPDGVSQRTIDFIWCVCGPMRVIGCLGEGLATHACAGVECHVYPAQQGDGG